MKVNAVFQRKGYTFSATRPQSSFLGIEGKNNAVEIERRLTRVPRNHLKEKRMDKKSALAASLVEEFVGKSHGDLERVKELLAQEPALINAAWDWGGGDWETGLGAAAHMGRSDIANCLLENGARLDLFAAAMLGQLEIVRAALAKI